jgi:virginiamycin B lyase
MRKKLIKIKKPIFFFIYILLSNSLFSREYDSLKPTQISAAAIATLKLEGYPDFLTADGNDVWVSNTGKMQKLSVKSKTPVLTVDIPDPCGAPVIGMGSLWVASCKNKSIYRIDSKTGKVIAIIQTNISDPDGEISLAFGAGAVWILSDSAGILTRIDANANAIKASIKVKPHSYCAVFGYHSVWITNTNGQGSVQRIDPATNSVIATIPVGPDPRFMAAGENGIWTLNQKDGTVSHIDPVANKLVSNIQGKVPGTGGDIAAGANRVWIRAKNGTFLFAIDPKTNKIVKKYAPLCGSGAVRVCNDYIWVTAHDINTIWVLHK